MIKEFNDSVVKFLNEIMKNAPVQKIEYYYLDLSEYPESVSVKQTDCLNNDDVYNKYLNYYWAEFDYNGKTYRLNMFYRDFDRYAGNIHVLPGIPQQWIKEINNLYDSNDYIITKNTVSKIYKKIIKYDYNGGNPYKELNWTPVLSMKNRSASVQMIWHEENIDNIAKNFWTDFANKNGFESCIQGKYSNRLYCSELIDIIYNGCDINALGQYTYSLLRWKNNTDRTMTAYYRMLYINDGYFCIYDQKPHILSLEHNSKGTNYLVQADFGYKWRIDYSYIKEWD